MWKKAIVVFGPFLAALTALAVVKASGRGDSKPDADVEPAARADADDPDDDDDDEHSGASLDLSDLSSFILPEAGERIMILGNEETGLRHCGPNAHVLIAGNRHHLELDGECGQIQITGNDNELKIEHANRIKISGNDNRLGVDATQDVAVIGNGNTVRYKTQREGEAPKLSSMGRDNKILKDDAAP